MGAPSFAHLANGVAASFAGGAGWVGCKPLPSHGSVAVAAAKAFAAAVVFGIEPGFSPRLAQPRPGLPLRAEQCRTPKRRPILPLFYEVAFIFLRFLPKNRVSSPKTI